MIRNVLHYLWIMGIGAFSLAEFVAIYGMCQPGWGGGFYLLILSTLVIVELVYVLIGLIVFRKWKEQ